MACTVSGHKASAVKHTTAKATAKAAAATMLHHAWHADMGKKATAKEFILGRIFFTLLPDVMGCLAKVL